MLAAVSAGSPLCVNATIIDALVFARSAFHHSMDYRSVLVFGRATRVVTVDQRDVVPVACKLVHP